MCISAAYSNAPLGNSASRWWDWFWSSSFPPSHFPFAHPLRTPLPYFFALPLRTSPSHFPFALPLRTSPSHFPFALPLCTSPSHFPFALPLVGRLRTLVLEFHTSPVRSRPRPPPTCTAFSSLTNHNWGTCKAFAVRTDQEDPPGCLLPLVIRPCIE